MNKLKLISVTSILFILITSWAILQQFDLEKPVILDISRTTEVKVEKIKPHISVGTEKLNDPIYPIIDQSIALSAPRETISQSVGDTRLFWVPNTATLDHYQINATLKLISQHSLIYSNLSSSYDSNIPSINNTFESTIYPATTSFFGNPPDIDGNGKIIILLFDIIDDYTGGLYVAGFFYALNQYLNSDLHPSQRYSNEAEILHIDKLGVGDFEVIAHEFQHLIHFGYDDDENLWLDEGASMFTEYLANYEPFSSGTYKTQFQNNPDVSLTYWDYNNIQGLVMANYAASYAFYRYLAEHYGGASIIKNIVQRTSNGITSVVQGLNALGYMVTFPEVFRNWTIANFLDDRSIADGKYGYENLSLAMAIEQTFSISPVPYTQNTVPYWGTDYLQFQIPPELPFNFQFQGGITAKYLLTAILTNSSTFPLNTEVIEIPVSLDGLASFSREDYNLTADQITMVISSFTKAGTPDYSDDDAAPAIPYWFMVNPNGVIINPGQLLPKYDQGLLSISNVTVMDSNQNYWEVADGSTYDIISLESGFTTNITGNLTYNPLKDYWEALDIDISDLSEGSYQVKMYFFNTTAFGLIYSETFVLSTSSTTQTTTTPGLIISYPNILILILSFTLSGLLFRRKK
ncbi:hypothetical protein [Candidatus Hodarchaeum mangrovi]